MRIGDAFHHVRTCDRYRPIYYAAGSGDFNPLHVDPEFGRRAGHPGAILQGMCTFGWLGEACSAYAGDPGAISLLAARFSRPVAAGDEVRFEGRCVAVEDGVARLEVAAVNGRGEDVLRNARAEVRLGAAPPPPRAALRGAAYGPYVFEAGLEKIRDFALAISASAPARLPLPRPAEPAPHSWHVDEAAARASPYGAVIAPPTFAGAYALPVFAAAIADPASPMDLLRVLHGEQELRLHAVVRAGDRLVTEGGIVSRAPKGDLEVVRIESRTVNGRGELVCEGVWTAIVR